MSKKIKKGKLREKIYDLVYSDDPQLESEKCSKLYDKLIVLLEKAGVYLDKVV